MIMADHISGSTSLRAQHCRTPKQSTPSALVSKHCPTLYPQEQQGLGFSILMPPPRGWGGGNDFSQHQDYMREEGQKGWYEMRNSMKDKSNFLSSLLETGEGRDSTSTTGHSNTIGTILLIPSTGPWISPWGSCFFHTESSFCEEQPLTPKFWNWTCPFEFTAEGEDEWRSDKMLE